MSEEGPSGPISGDSIAGEHLLDELDAAPAARNADARRSPRVPLYCTAVFVSLDGSGSAPRKVQLRDLSREGACFLDVIAPAVGILCRLEMRIPHAESFMFYGQVVRSRQIT